MQSLTFFTLFTFFTFFTLFTFRYGLLSAFSITYRLHPCCDSQYYEQPYTNKGSNILNGQTHRWIFGA